LCPVSRKATTGILQFDPDIGRTERALCEAIPIQDYSSEALEMGDRNPCITLGDYGRLDNLDEVSLGFQLQTKYCSISRIMRS